MTTIVLATLTIGMFLALCVAFFLITFPPKCPRCGARHWIHSPHMGKYVVYCPKCLLFLDTTTGKQL